MLNNVKMTNDLYCVVNVNNDNTLSFVDNINPLLKNEIETNVDKECAENTAYNVEVLTQQDIAPNYGINWLTVDRVFSFNEVDCLSVKYYVMNRLKEYITQENYAQVETYITDLVNDFYWYTKKDINSGLNKLLNRIVQMDKYLNLHLTMKISSNNLYFMLSEQPLIVVLGDHLCFSERLLHSGISNIMRELSMMRDELYAIEKEDNSVIDKPKMLLSKINDYAFALRHHKKTSCVFDISFISNRVFLLCNFFTFAVLESKSFSKIDIDLIKLHCKLNSSFYLQDLNAQLEQEISENKMDWKDIINDIARSQYRIGERTFTVCDNLSVQSKQDYIKMFLQALKTKKLQAALCFFANQNIAAFLLEKVLQPLSVSFFIEFLLNPKISYEIDVNQEKNIMLMRIRLIENQDVDHQENKEILRQQMTALYALDIDYYYENAELDMLVSVKDNGEPFGFSVEVRRIFLCFHIKFKCNSLTCCF